ncbi:hypothetical protein HYU21_05005 [Candidatus Woesearchaeota archaeon]|nr:hypothetical protein [Candidatus Woesearchaeota archaeon]
MNQNTKPYLDNFVAYLEANKDKQNLVNTAKMAKFLDPLSDQKNYMINFHWNPTGWFTLLGVHSEDSTLHLNFSATYLVKPTLLETFYFLRRPDLSFLRMEYKGLEPTGINDYENGERPEREEYVECLGNLYSRSCWDEGRTEDGRTIGLEAELQVRELKDGTFMIIPKGNLLNTSDFDAHRNDIAASGRNSSVLQELIRRFG